VAENNDGMSLAEHSIRAAVSRVWGVYHDLS
jgi:hypothetical protein